jgi:hypothetical protein
MAQTADGSRDQGPVDALDVLEGQDDVISDVLEQWRQETAQLETGDSVAVRWERGSAAKLLLQYFALRESAKEALAGHLRSRHDHELAARVEGDGVARRAAIDRLDEAIRGLQAISANTPEITEALRRLGEIFDAEVGEDRKLLPELTQILGKPGERGLPSARHVRTHSPTRPSPTPKWYDRVGPIKAVRALYDHLRGSPSGGTSPGLDNGREHTPGLRS